MLVYKHKDCLLKDNGFNHPERKERISSILESIKQITNFKIDFKDAPLADIETISLVHPPDFQLNKFFYKLIGKDHNWNDRLLWNDRKWINYINNIKVKRSNF